MTESDGRSFLISRALAAYFDDVFGGSDGSAMIAEHVVVSHLGKSYVPMTCCTCGSGSSCSSEEEQRYGFENISTDEVLLVFSPQVIRWPAGAGELKGTFEALAATDGDESYLPVGRDGVYVQTKLLHARAHHVRALSSSDVILLTMIRLRYDLEGNSRAVVLRENWALDTIFSSAAVIIPFDD